MVRSSASSCSPSPAASTSSRTSASPAGSGSQTETSMVPGTTTHPVITSFAMKGDSVSPGPSRGNGEIQPDILSPMDIDDLLNQLQDCNAIRYAAYRTASKLDLLRSGLRLDQVKLGAVSSVFHQRGYSKISKSNRASPHSEINQVLLDRAKVADIITDIFFAAGKVRTYYCPILDVAACTDTALRIVMLIYKQGDSRKIENISVKALKTFFVVLSEARLKDKFSYLFREFADGEGNSVTMSRSGLIDLLETLCQLPGFLGESVSFGEHLAAPAATQCFEVMEDKKGICEADLMKWLVLEPQIIVWLTTLYRLLSAKGIRHGIRCANCKIKEITGMRYQCLRCMRYNLCQHCFFYGLLNRGHRLDHPMQEYCFRSSKKDATKAWMRLLVNNLMFVGRRNTGQRNSQKRFLPHDPKFDKKSEPVKRRTLAVDNRSGHDEVDAMQQEDDDSSGFDSAVSSNQEGAIDSPAIRPSMAKTPNLNRITQEAEFNAILHHLELNNAQMLERLKKLEKLQKKKNGVAEMPDASQTTFSIQQPLTNCLTMQQQLDRLKQLMENVFGAAQDGRHPNLAVSASQADRRKSQQIEKIRNSMVLEMNSVAGFEPSSFAIESTPVVVVTDANHKNIIKTKKLSRLALDNHFSPIVLQKPPESTDENILRPPALPSVADVSAVVDTFLNDDDTSDFKGDDLDLSNISLADLTSLLAKTGYQGQTLLDMNITNCLTPHLGADPSNLDVMEDLESVLQRLEDVFQSFHDHTLTKKNTLAYNNDAVIIGQIVSEIGDQLDAFAHHYRDSVAPLTTC